MCLLLQRVLHKRKKTEKGEEKHESGWRVQSVVTRILQHRSAVCAAHSHTRTHTRAPSPLSPRTFSACDPTASSCLAPRAPRGAPAPHFYLCGSDCVVRESASFVCLCVCVWRPVHFLPPSPLSPSRLPLFYYASGADTYTSHFFIFLWFLSCLASGSTSPSPFR